MRHHTYKPNWIIGEPRTGMGNSLPIIQPRNMFFTPLIRALRTLVHRL